VKCLPYVSICLGNLVKDETLVSLVLVLGCRGYLQKFTFAVLISYLLVEFQQVIVKSSSHRFLQVTV